MILILQESTGEYDTYEKQNVVAYELPDFDGKVTGDSIMDAFRYAVQEEAFKRGLGRIWHTPANSLTFEDTEKMEQLYKDFGTVEEYILRIFPKARNLGRIEEILIN